MNTDRLTTLLGLLAGSLQVYARQDIGGVALGAAFALLGYFTNKSREKPMFAEILRNLGKKLAAAVLPIVLEELHNLIEAELSGEKKEEPQG